MHGGANAFANILHGGNLVGNLTKVSHTLQMCRSGAALTIII